MDTPRASPAESRETLEQPIAVTNQQPDLHPSVLHRLQAEQRALKEENVSLRVGMQELLMVVKDLALRVTTIEQQGNLLQHAVIDTNLYETCKVAAEYCRTVYGGCPGGYGTFSHQEYLRRLRRKVDCIGDDLAVTKNEFDLGRYDM